MMHLRPILDLVTSCEQMDRSSNHRKQRNHFNDNCAFFTEEANTLKKLSIELPSKNAPLNLSTILAPKL